ncbi:IST1 homolog [Dreissena polymorpha]|uniref:IST1 homolog n=1 Tax=Dreissena polymorpha TaxID=45954 RepID=UPI002264F795|nr:IST1 homolog [Dreissena polymorpha]
MLIDLDDGKKGGASGGSGKAGGGGGDMMMPQAYYQQPPPPSQSAMHYPHPKQPQPPQLMAGKAPPPLPNTPPSGHGASYQNGGASAAPSAPAAGQEHSPPLPYTSNMNFSKGGGGYEDSFPELHAVPNSILPDPPGSKSSGGEGVDFDDLSRRFEELKRKK